MIEGYFRLMGAYRRPFIDVDVSLPGASSLPIRIAFEVDTGADRTVLSPWDGQRLYDSFGLDIRTMPQGNPIGGIGGIVQTRTVRATLVLGSYQTTMPLHVVDLPPGPSDMPSLIGRDIIYDFALFMEHSADTLHLLRTGEEIIPLLES
ncbi:MAG: hypothetical protein F4X34_00880 [Chloroflexi bacterium]|nr:hypothetical protein [Chloroflexota bacterium]